MNGYPAARRCTVLFLFGAVVTLAACGKSQDTAADSTTAAGTASAGATPSAAATSDTAMAGMKHDSAGGATGMAMNDSAPKDSNQAFLRMMVDHHQGLIAMASDAQGKLQSATAKSDAQKLIDEQKSEQQRMKDMLSSTYSDQHMPMIMPSNKAMNDSLQATQPGAQYDKDFYHHVIAHHREGVQMAEKMMPQLTGDVKAMAQKSVAQQRREIQEFEKKGGAGGPKG